MKIQPIIKWSGSKRSQADKIVEEMPDKINTYYEPFVGGASVFIKLATHPRRTVSNFVLSDLNSDLISLWNKVKDNPKSVSKHYKELWLEMKKEIGWDEKSFYYTKIRQRFNEKRSPLDFMFIMRTAFNGMVRYNSKGLFNTPLHPSRDGILPDKFDEVIIFWNKILNTKNVSFVCQSYENIRTKQGDLIYLDPPYAGIKGMYYGSLSDYEVLWSFLRKQKGKWIMSFDGKTTSESQSVFIPEDLYVNHKFLDSGNSSFRRLNGKSNKEYVFESLYKNYE